MPTRDELIAITKTFITKSAVDAFTNNRLNTVLLGLLSAGVMPSYATAEDFDEAMAAYPDLPMMAYVENDTVYTKDTQVVLMFVPGKGVGQVAVNFEL